ncbi:hypothetical protein B0H13DRAFT_2563458 [Mycena leptocephala]|nr:hypothetical protein B0H13DRAFT_2563458 [Mycena leptocephala]
MSLEDMDPALPFARYAATRLLPSQWRSLCINRRLYKIASCSSVSASKADKRCVVLVDLTIGLGNRFIQMSLQRLVLPHDLQRHPHLPLYYLWPNIINLIYACYVVLTLCEFLYFNAQFALLCRVFRPQHEPLLPLHIPRDNRARPQHPISAYGLYLSITHDQIRPWVSWANTHFDFGTIDVFPVLI